MKLRVLTAAAAVATGLAAMALTVDAGQRHWFYGQYGAYDQRAMTNFGWGYPSPYPYGYGYAPRRYYAYPRAYAAPPRGEPEFYYQVAPNTFVPVYRNQRGRIIGLDRNGIPIVKAPPRRKLANEPKLANKPKLTEESQINDEPKLTYVPKPKAKPEVPEQFAAKTPEPAIEDGDQPFVDSEQPAVELAVPTPERQALKVETPDSEELETEVPATEATTEDPPEEKIEDKPAAKILENKPAAKAIEEKSAAKVIEEKAADKPAAKAIEDKPAEKAVGTSISCDKARQIVVDFGFSDIETVGCAGKEYGFRARRDGKNFEVRLSSVSGELLEVKRR